MNYIKNIPITPSFSQDGMNGYSFILNNKDISIDMIESYKGHEKYCTNKASSHIYYILEGNGRFKINGEIYDVESGDLVEIPKNTEFVYIGKMKLLLIMNPAFDEKNHIDGIVNILGREYV